MQNILVHLAITAFVKYVLPLLKSWTAKTATDLDDEALAVLEKVLTDPAFQAHAYGK